MTTLPNPFINSAETTADTAVVSELLPPGATAVTYSPEPFSEYAARRSSPIVSPPMEKPKDEPREWPRGFDPERFACDIEEAPLFLRDGTPYRPMRKANPSFLQALFDLAGPER